MVVVGEGKEEKPRRGTGLSDTNEYIKQISYKDLLYNKQNMASIL